MILSSRKWEKANKDTETWENVRLYIQMLNETKLEEQNTVIQLWGVSNNYVV